MGKFNNKETEVVEGFLEDDEALRENERSNTYK